MSDSVVECHVLQFLCTCHLPSLLLEGLDGKSEPCQRFFRDGLTLSFVRVLDDDAVNAWNPDIQVSRSSS